MALRAAGLSEGVTMAILGEISSALANAGAEASVNLSDSFARQAELTSNMAEQHQKMQELMVAMNTEKDVIKGHMDRMHNDAEKSKLQVLELDAKAEKVAQLMVQMEQATQASMVTIRSSYGGHLERIEGQMSARFAFIDGQYGEASDAMRRANEKIGFLEGAMASGGGFGGKSGGSSGKGGGGKPDAMESNLISIKDIVLPKLNDASPSVATFRRWWKDLAKYCQRRDYYWRGAETMFKVIRGYPNEIVVK